MRDVRNAYKILFGKPERKRSFRRIRFRLQENIELDFKEIGFDYVDWILSDLDRGQ
jgi:hypothetical protein